MAKKDQNAEYKEGTPPDFIESVQKILQVDIKDVDTLIKAERAAKGKSKKPKAK